MRTIALSMRGVQWILAAALSLSLSLSGCAGHGSAGVLPGVHAPLLKPAPASRLGKMVDVAFKVRWKKHRRSSSVRPHYLPATARSASISVNGGVPQYLNAPSQTLSVTAPVGTDTFAIAVYDELNGEGAVLAVAMVTKKITTAGPNTVSAVLDGVVAALQVTLSNPNPPAGVATTSKVYVAAMDPDGNTIVGNSDYDRAIHVSLTDPSGSLKLSSDLLQGPWAAAPVLTMFVRRSVWSATVTASAADVPPASAIFAPTIRIVQNRASDTVASHPQWIAAGPDGRIWYTEPNTNLISAINVATTATSDYPVSTANSGVEGITVGNDGQLWYTETNANQIGSISTNGTRNEYAALFGNSSPFLLTNRGDGSLWYAGSAGFIGYQNPNGSAGEKTLPTSPVQSPYGIAAAHDLNLYYTDNANDQIARTSNLTDAISYNVLTPGSGPRQIVLGPDGNLWFTEYGTSKIGRLSPGCFCLTGEFPTLQPNEGPTGITVGKDGALWFTTFFGNTIGRVTTDGTVSEYAVAGGGAFGWGLTGITAAPDGSLWAAEAYADRVVSLYY